MSSRRSVTAVLLAALILLLVTTNRPALQMVAALATCLLLPGLGWARKLRLGDRGDTFALALVISLCSTVAVSTTMAVSGRWSVAAGLGVLAAVTVTGFVPFGQLAARAGAVLPAPVPVDGERVAWVDWYDDVRRRAAEQRAAERAAAVEASARWAEWYERNRAGTSEPVSWEPETAERPDLLDAVVGAPSPAAPAPVPVVPVVPVPPVAEDPAEDELSGVGPEWTDWYAAARDRDDKARRRAERLDGAAGQEWREWFRRASADAPIRKP